MLTKDESWGQENVRNAAAPSTAARIRRRAGAAIAGAIKAGAGAYDRARDLPGLVRLAPSEFAAETIECTSIVVARLERALRAERNRARSGHWTYDLNRHIALRQAFVAESERLRILEGQQQS